jgi:hypothetical protein
MSLRAPCARAVVATLEAGIDLGQGNGSARCGIIGLPASGNRGGPSAIS